MYRHCLNCQSSNQRWLNRQTSAILHSKQSVNWLCPYCFDPFALNRTCPTWCLCEREELKPIREVRLFSVHSVSIDLTTQKCGFVYMTAKQSVDTQRCYECQHGTSPVTFLTWLRNVCSPEKSVSASSCLPHFAATLTPNTKLGADVHSLSHTQTFLTEYINSFTTNFKDDDN